MIEKILAYILACCNNNEFEQYLNTNNNNEAKKGLNENNQFQKIRYF